MKSITTILITILFQFSTVFLSEAQVINVNNTIDTEKDRAQFNIFDFEGTDKYNIVFPVPESLDTFNITVKAYIGAGDLSIEIFDPAGEQQGNFKVKGQSELGKTFTHNFINRALSMSTTKQHIENDPRFFTFNDEIFKHDGLGNKVAQASMSRLFREPATGAWVIKAECVKAKGFFTVENNEWLLKSNMPTEFVNGTVVDNKNRPLAGAIIKPKNGYGGTTADDKGEFTVSLRDEAERNGEPEIIVVQYKKMKKEVVIGDQPKITVVLDDKK